MTCWFILVVCVHFILLSLCRLLYTRSGEWSDGTVPILATTAAGFTYIALLVVSLAVKLLQGPNGALTLILTS